MSNLFAEQVIAVEQRIDDGELVTTARRLQGAESTAVSDEIEAVKRSVREVEIYQSGVRAGQLEVIDKVLSTAEAHARIATICGRQDGADLLLNFVSAIRDEFAR